MIIKNYSEIIQKEPVVLEYSKFGYKVYISLEGLNPFGNIKYSPAINIVKALENTYTAEELKKYSIIESSSGNFALALAQICKQKGYKLTTVIDPLASKNVQKILSLYNANIVMVHKRDDKGSYLGTRIDKVKELVMSGKYIWTNQYHNNLNPMGHYNITAARLYKCIPKPDYLVIGAGTCGTLMGFAKFFKEQIPNIKVIAVDVDGSVALGGAAKPRRIPGMGSSRPSSHLDLSYIDDMIWIDEKSTLIMLKELLENTGILFGGSTGTVLAGIKKYFRTNNIKPKKVLTISPDFGIMYIDIYTELGWGKI